MSQATHKLVARELVKSIIELRRSANGLKAVEELRSEASNLLECIEYLENYMRNKVSATIRFKPNEPPRFVFEILDHVGNIVTTVLMDTPDKLENLAEKLFSNDKVVEHLVRDCTDAFTTLASKLVSALESVK